MNVPILLVSARAEDAPNLKAILEDTPWRLVEAASSAEAVQALKRAAFPIVLYDRDLADGAWQETLRILLAAPGRACAILLSGVADEYLWNEVVERGGFDVLTRPFRKEQVISMLDFAHTHWKTEWPATKV